MSEYVKKMLENIERNTQNAEDLLRSIDGTLGDALVPGEAEAPEIHAVLCAQAVLLERVAVAVEKLVPSPDATELHRVSGLGGSVERSLYARGGVDGSVRDVPKDAPRLGAWSVVEAVSQALKVSEQADNTLLITRESRDCRKCFRVHRTGTCLLGHEQVLWRCNACGEWQ